MGPVTQCEDHTGRTTGLKPLSLGPAIWTSSEVLVEMQNLRPHPDLMEWTLRHNQTLGNLYAPSQFWWAYWLPSFVQSPGPRQCPWPLKPGQTCLRIPGAHHSVGLQ